MPGGLSPSLSFFFCLVSFCVGGKMCVCVCVCICAVVMYAFVLFSFLGTAKAVKLLQDHLFKKKRNLDYFHADEGNPINEAAVNTRSHNIAGGAPTTRQTRTMKKEEAEVEGVSTLHHTSFPRTYRPFIEGTSFLFLIFLLLSLHSYTYSCVVCVCVCVY
jgi:hypothetical protein